MLRFTSDACYTPINLSLYFDRISQMVADRCLNTDEVLSTDLTISKTENMPILTVQQRFGIIEKARKLADGMRSEFDQSVAKIQAGDCKSRIIGILEVVDKLASGVNCGDL